MRHTLHIPRITALAAAAAALLSAGSALAVENLYGGGATFPAVPYVGTGYLTPSTPSNPAGQIARLSTNAGNAVGNPFATASISASSIFDAYTGATANKISYCQTGSGFGKTVLNTATGTATGNGLCKDFRTTVVPPSTTANPEGFSGANVIADYIGTDAPYSTTDYNAFLTGAPATSNGRTGITQFPVLAGAIGLPHATGPITNNLPLTTSQVCRIYSGLITTWNQISGSGSSGTIKIVYRTDGSGTSFAFTSYLAAKCNGTADVPSGFSFAPNQSFDTAVGGVNTRYGSTRVVGVSGNANVVTTTRTTTDAQGYADVGEVIAQSAEYALVNGFNPTTFGGGTTQVSINPTATSGTPANPNLLSGKVLDGAVINNVPGTAAAAVKNCVRLVNPAATISSAYPIVAITYLAGYYGNNGSATHVQSIKDLYNRFYLTPVTSRASLPAGFAYLDGVATFRSLITTGASPAGTITNCVN